MKKKLVTSILLVMVCMLSACGESDQKDTTKINTQQENQSNVSKQTEANSIEFAGYVFQAGSADEVEKVDVVIDAEAESILNDLGEAESVYESPSCAFGDLDIIYTYDGFEVDTYSIEGVEYISAVILLDDTVETPEGICIGDEVSKVMDIYGKPAKNDATLLEYRKDHMKLSFIIQDEMVLSIEYATTILEE